MAVAPIPLNAGPTGSESLNQRLTRGGVSAARLEMFATGQWWAAPQDEQRYYISFTLNPPFLTAQISPGDDNAPAGYWLTPEHPTIEFAGKSLKNLVSGVWWITSDGALNVDVVVLRDI